MKDRVVCYMTPYAGRYAYIAIAGADTPTARASLRSIDQPWHCAAHSLTRFLRAKQYFAIEGLTLTS
jgi:hypothetical protein